MSVSKEVETICLAVNNNTYENSFVTIFFFRGKVSEGIDFTDNKGRVVIITGSSN